MGIRGKNCVWRIGKMCIRDRVKADKETTSDIYEKTKTEGVKEKKESTLPEQIGFACVCVTVLLVVVLIVKHWRNRQSSS